jgi:hypothetical protein
MEDMRLEAGSRAFYNHIVVVRERYEKLFRFNCACPHPMNAKMIFNLGGQLGFCGVVSGKNGDKTYLSEALGSLRTTLMQLSLPGELIENAMKHIQYGGDSIEINDEVIGTKQQVLAILEKCRC